MRKNCLLIKLLELFELEFDMSEKVKREQLFIEGFSNEKNVKKLIELL